MILGASGLLGKALTHEWTGDEVAGFGSRQVDIRDAHKVMEAVKKIDPEWIVLAAAYTNVDDCESHPDLAFAVNRDGAVNVAQAAKLERREAAVPQFRLRLRWNEDFSL